MAGMPDGLTVCPRAVSITPRTAGIILKGTDMPSLMGTIQLLIGVGGLLTLAFLILLAIPNSELRRVLMPIVGWGMAIFCGIYCISPLDVAPEALLGPFGLIDDVGAAIVGFTAASMARKVSEE
jgi:hypothetical protein